MAKTTKSIMITFIVMLVVSVMYVAASASNIYAAGVRRPYETQL